MEKREVKSVVPVYAVGIFWLAYSIFFPLYRGAHYIVAAVLSVAVYFIAKKLAPKKYIEVEVDPIARTKDEKLNEVIDEANKTIREIRRLNSEIQDELVSAKIDGIEKLTKEIFGYVIKNPSNISSIRRFISYYLPTTLKLLTAYAELEKQNVKTENISSTMSKISDMLDTIEGAFVKQYDSLYDATAMDISSEITAMESILATEGLTDTERFDFSVSSDTGLKL